TFVGDAGRQHPVERTDAVGGHDDEPVAEVVNVADLAAAARGTGDLALQERRGGHAEGSSSWGHGNAVGTTSAGAGMLWIIIGPGAQTDNLWEVTLTSRTSAEGCVKAAVLYNGYQTVRDR